MQWVALEAVGLLTVLSRLMHVPSSHGFPRGARSWSRALCNLGWRSVHVTAHVDTHPRELGGCCISCFSWQVLDAAASLPGSEVPGAQGGEVRGARRWCLPESGPRELALVVQGLFL